MRPVAEAEAMAALFDRLDHQRPATCGAYVLAYLFPALGLRSHEGHDLSAEDYLAHLAAVVVEADEVGPSEAVGREVAAGHLSEQDALHAYGRIWYRYPVRSSADPVEAGTSPSGVMRAVALGSSGDLTTLPIAARLDDGTIQLTEDRWSALLAELAANTDTWAWHAVLNYETDRLLKPDDPAYSPDGLRTWGPDSGVPLDDWGVGHFVGLAGLWRRQGDGAWWLLLFDTYKDRGFSGYEPQPAALMRDGLIRADGRGGGIILIVPRDQLSAVSTAVVRLGLTPGVWRNGSPEPDDWTWELGR
ncbi:MAG TPA: hypothetical protein VFW92_01400 [Candidatus Limnocylindrales bacterium]|nr:hypothetical protein [Candidatus Limnocylindrales bacterium]